jgi:hypothetical protein
VEASTEFTLIGQTMSKVKKLDDLTPDDRDFIKRVAADVRKLEASCKPGVSEDDLRQSSPVLRSFSNGDFHRAWKLLAQREGW